MSRRSRTNSDAVTQRPANGSDYPRRRSQSAAEPQPQGWRATKRSSKLGHKVRRQQKAERLKSSVRDGARATRNTVIATLQVIGMAVGGVLAVLVVLFVLALGVNAGARWLAEREAREEASPEAQAEKAEENLVVIGKNGDGSAEFLAVRLDEEGEQILGIGIPSGAFMEVPGQGFERVGDSLSGGPGVSLAAISNYLSIPFEHYVVVDVAIYQDAMTNQSLRTVMENVQETDLSEEDRARIAGFIEGVKGERTALVPLPVRPIDLGGETFFEPQRDQISDLLLQWWGVRLGAEDTSVRVILYNGSGTPGIAGEAAQQVIAAGLRVVDTKNADRFDYDTTLIVVQSGETSHGELVQAALGVGEIVEKPSEQEVADVIVIIGRDYQPAAASEQ